MKITLTHGSGGKATGELITSVFAKHFGNEILNKMEDSAVVPGYSRIAVTTDSFVITPLFFKGGDIGKLCICGTVNDLLMSGSVPRYITIGFIIEEGMEIELLERIAESASAAAKEAGVMIIAGDTKVIEGNGGVYINTAGIGSMPEGLELGFPTCRAGDAILLSGTIGDHHAAVLSARLGIENSIQSDCAPLNDSVRTLFDNGIRVRAMRDVTRGGLATVLNEIAGSSGLGIEIDEDRIPVAAEVAGLCGLLGLDPLYMANEGKFLVVVDSADAQRAVEKLGKTRYGKDATIIGTVTGGRSVILRTRIGGRRKIDVLYGEGLPRIC